MSDENNDNKKPIDTNEEQKTVPYDRFKEVNTKVKALEAELEQIRVKQKEEEDKRLKESQDWKTLAETKEKQLAELEGSLKKAKLEGAVKDLVSQKKVKNPNLVIKALDLSGVNEKDGNFDLSAIETQLSELQKNDPYLFGESNPTIGNPNAGTPDNVVGKTYKRSQLTDQEFYRANRDDIQKAQKEGRIIDG